MLGQSSLRGSGFSPAVPTVQSAVKRPAIFLQDACYGHQYIRSKDLSAIVERPERLRAVTVGLSAAIARLETILPVEAGEKTQPRTSAKKDSPDDLVEALERMKIVLEPHTARHTPVSIIQSQATIDLLANPAVKFVHGDVDGDIHPRNIKEWAEGSLDKIRKGESEIPTGLPQGDLYLCPESLNAIQGALGTVCEAVDMVVSSTRQPTQANSGDTAGLSADIAVQRAFVAVRPPGHHCGEDTPSGFCFVNNVAVAAAHAYLQHGIKRIVILDIDLHHGNGTQSIVWQINEETYRQTLESEGGGTSQPTKFGPQIFYGSIHDILSFPCEDGKIELVQAASVSLHGSHGQHIENVHLQTYTSEDHFWNVLYRDHYSKLLRKAGQFLDSTGGPGDDAIVFISCGMDACEHEYESMSRHNRKVPTSFYYRYARDVCAFSDHYALGRVVSVLEGGYSDRALIGGAMAHLSGLFDVPPSGGAANEEWWNVENLVMLEKATKKRRGGRQSVNGVDSIEPWLERTLAIFSSLESHTHSPSMASLRNTLVPASSMTLRERKSKSNSPVPSTRVKTRQPARNGPQDKVEPLQKADSLTPILDSSNSTEGEPEQSISQAPKKLPRVILRLGPEPTKSTGS